MRAMRILCLLCGVLCTAVVAADQSQYKVLYSFGTSGSSDGSLPEGKLVMDKVGNLYGTTAGGGLGAGTVFELSPAPDGKWSEAILYNFCSQQQCSDGQKPMAGLTLDQFGNLYGTTYSGGQGGNDCCMGTVFELSPPSVRAGVWTEAVLWRFLGSQGKDGSFPVSRLIFDAEGNLYGTTLGGGSGSEPAGTVFKLTPSGNGTWNETILYTFQCQKSGGGCLNGSQPYAGVTFDKAGNLYGTTWQGGGQGEGGGIVYKLSPGQKGWSQSVLYNFTTPGNLHGIGPKGAVNIDSQGNLYSTVTGGGEFGFGGVFRLTPANGGHEYTLSFHSTDGIDPEAGVLIDPRNGNLYGTASGGGDGNGCCGTVFKVAGKKVTVLHSFNGTDGKWPVAALIADKKGHLYGTTKLGGDFNKGVVFEILP